MNDQIVVYVYSRADRKNLYMKYYDPFTGEMESKTTGTNRKKEAIKIAAVWESELRSGKYKKTTLHDWSEFEEQYKCEVLSTLARNSYKKGCYVLDEFNKLVRPKNMSVVNTALVSKYQSELRRKGNQSDTIKGKLSYIKAAFNWAVRQGILKESPVFEVPKRTKKNKLMKGRPVTGEEFDRMVEAIPDVVSQKRVKAWEHYLKGLWWSGLRLQESLELTWDDLSKLNIDLTKKHPVLAIPGEHEKGNQDRLLPIAPEFAEMILATPEEDRTGYFFEPLPERDNASERLKRNQTGKIISQIGKAANVAVNAGKTTKYASAHDLRRAFGTRWATRVMPAVLQELMRHESIETTLKYYVSRSVQETSDLLYQSLNENDDFGASFGATSEKETKNRTTM